MAQKFKELPFCGKLLYQDLERSLAELNEADFNNGLIIDLLPYLTNGHPVSWAQFHTIVAAKLASVCTLPSFKLAINRCYKRYTYLKKTQKSEVGRKRIDDFLEAAFKPPTKIVDKMNVDQHESTINDVNKMNNEQKAEDLCPCQRAKKRRVDEDVPLNKLKKELIKYKQEVDNYKSLFGNVKGGKKRITEKIKRLQKSKNEWKVKCNDAEGQVKRNKSKIRRLKKQLNEERRRRRTISRKYDQARDSMTFNNQQEVKQLTNKIDELEDDIDILKQPPIVSTKIHQSYTPQIREASYYLQV